jgi:S-(hydroxymethyl)glutathione dehydrogenase/alcohol dehydrogenase
MTMRAFAFDEFGTAGSIRELPVSDPDSGEILVTVHAAGVNVMEPYTVSGALKDYMEHRFPLVPGIDFAGVVDRIGAGVDGFAPGDEVYGIAAKPFIGAGSYAESLVVGAGSAAPKPESLDFTQAAAVPHVGLTALGAVELADPQPGQTIVVVGATGGVGSFVTQMAAARGATVVAVTTAAGAAQAREQGATDTIKGGPEAVQQILEMTDGFGADYTFEATGNVTVMQQAVEAARMGWGLCTVAGVAGKGETLDIVPRLLITGRRVAGSSFGGVKGRTQVPQFVDLYMQGEIDVDPFVSHHLTLDEVNKGFELMEAQDGIRSVIHFE